MRASSSRRTGKEAREHDNKGTAEEERKRGRVVSMKGAERGGKDMVRRMKDEKECGIYNNREGQASTDRRWSDIQRGSSCQCSALSCSLRAAPQALPRLHSKSRIRITHPLDSTRALCRSLTAASRSSAQYSADCQCTASMYMPLGRRIGYSMSIGLGSTCRMT